jgi:predicted DNA binding CopG/RHH family protein
MALRKRPKPEDRDKWISEAATSDKPQQLEEEETKTIQDIRLRIPTDLLEEIDQSVAKRKPKISRHNWILEALHEKVKREKKKL